MSSTRQSPTGGVDGLISMFEVLNTSSRDANVEPSLIVGNRRGLRCSCPQTTKPSQLSRKLDELFLKYNGRYNYLGLQPSSLTQQSQYLPGPADPHLHSSILSSFVEREGESTSSLVDADAASPVGQAAPRLSTSSPPVAERRRRFETLTADTNLSLGVGGIAASATGRPAHSSASSLLLEPTSRPRNQVFVSTAETRRERPAAHLATTTSYPQPHVPQPSVFRHVSVPEWYEDDEHCPELYQPTSSPTKAERSTPSAQASPRPLPPAPRYSQTWSFGSFSNHPVLADELPPSDTTSPRPTSMPASPAGSRGTVQNLKKMFDESPREAETTTVASNRDRPYRAAQTLSPTSQSTFQTRTTPPSMHAPSREPELSPRKPTASTNSLGMPSRYFGQSHDTLSMERAGESAAAHGRILPRQTAHVHQSPSLLARGYQEGAVRGDLPGAAQSHKGGFTARKSRNQKCWRRPSQTWATATARFDHQGTRRVHAVPAHSVTDSAARIVARYATDRPDVQLGASNKLHQSGNVPPLASDGSVSKSPYPDRRTDNSITAATRRIDGSSWQSPSIAVPGDDRWSLSTSSATTVRGGWHTASGANTRWDHDSVDRQRPDTMVVWGRRRVSVKRMAAPVMVARCRLHHPTPVRLHQTNRLFHALLDQTPV